MIIQGGYGCFEDELSYYRLYVAEMKLLTSRDGDLLVMLSVQFALS